MTEPGDKLSRSYRELAREEPPAALDAAILKAAGENRGQTPGSAPDGSRVTGVRRQRWIGPISIAAVLVLGIGIALRMQLEQPGIETSAPSSSSAEYPMPDVEPASPQPRAAQKPPPKQEERAREAKAVEKVKPQAKRIEAPARADVAPPRQAASESNPFADAPVAIQHAPVAGGPSTTLGATAPAAPPAPAPSRAEAEPAPATAESARAAAESARAAAPAAGSIAPQAAAPRAKRQGFATDSAATRETRAIAAVADPDPDRELERIARLREAGRHADADRALEELRRRHPDLRIPEPMWERVRPR